MALFSHRVGQVKRSCGQTAASSLAYCLGMDIKNEQTGKTYSSAYKSTEVTYRDIFLPEHAPIYLKDAPTFANVVEKGEHRHDAQLLRTLFFALPRELTTEQQIALVQEIVHTAFVRKGMCAAVAIHDKGDGNPHCHLRLTMREIEADGTFGKKVREWNERGLVKEWMHTVANLTNKHLERAGSDARISALSYAEQGRDKEPTVHLGRYAHQLKLWGLSSELDTLNQQIRADNARRVEIRELLAKLEEASLLERDRLEKQKTLAGFESRLQQIEIPLQEARRAQQPEQEAVRRQHRPGTEREAFSQAVLHAHNARVGDALSVDPELRAGVQQVTTLAGSKKSSFHIFPFVEEMLSLDLDCQEEQEVLHVIDFQRVKREQCFAPTHHERTELERDQAECYATEEWDGSPARRRYDEGHRRTPGKPSPSHSPVRAALEKSSGQGHGQPADLLREYVGYEWLLSAPSPDKPPPDCGHIRPPSRRGSGQEMQPGPEAR